MDASAEPEMPPSNARSADQELLAVIQSLKGQQDVVIREPVLSGQNTPGSGSMDNATRADSVQNVDQELEKGEGTGEAPHADTSAESQMLDLSTEAARVTSGSPSAPSFDPLNASPPEPSLEQRDRTPEPAPFSPQQVSEGSDRPETGSNAPNVAVESAEAALSVEHGQNLEPTNEIREDTSLDPLSASNVSADLPEIGSKPSILPGEPVEPAGGLANVDEPLLISDEPKEPIAQTSGSSSGLLLTTKTAEVENLKKKDTDEVEISAARESIADDQADPANDAEEPEPAAKVDAVEVDEGLKADKGALEANAVLKSSEEEGRIGLTEEPAKIDSESSKDVEMTPEITHEEMPVSEQHQQAPNDLDRIEQNEQSVQPKPDVLSRSPGPNDPEELNTEVNEKEKEPVTELKQPSDSPVRHENAEEQPEANEEAEVAGKEEAAMDLEEKQGDDGKESEIPFVDEEHQSESAPGLEQDRSSDEPQAFEVVETTAPKPSSESLEIKNAQEEKPDTDLPQDEKLYSALPEIEAANQRSSPSHSGASGIVEVEMKQAPELDFEEAQERDSVSPEPLSGPRSPPSEPAAPRDTPSEPLRPAQEVEAPSPAISLPEPEPELSSEKQEAAEEKDSEMKSEEESDGMEVDEKDETDSEKESERSEQEEPSTPNSPSMDTARQPIVAAKPIAGKRPALLLPRANPRPSLLQVQPKPTTANHVQILEPQLSPPNTSPPETSRNSPESKRKLNSANATLSSPKRAKIFRSPLAGKPLLTPNAKSKPVTAPSTPKRGGPYLPPLSYLIRVAEDEANVRAALLLGRVFEGMHDLNELSLFPEDDNEDEPGDSSKPAPDLPRALKYYWIAAGEESEEGVLGVGRLLLRTGVTIPSEDEGEALEAAEKKETAKRMLVELAEQKGNLEAMKLLAELDKAEEEAEGGRHGGEEESGMFGGAKSTGISVKWLQETLLETGWDEDVEQVGSGSNNQSGVVQLDAHGVPPLPQPADPSKASTTITPDQLLHLLRNPPDSAPLPRPLPRLRYLVQAYTEHRHLPSLFQALPALLTVSPELGLRYLEAEKHADPVCARYLARLKMMWCDPVGAFSSYKALIDDHGFAGDPECVEMLCGILVRGGKMRGVGVVEDEEDEDNGSRQGIARDMEAAKRYLLQPETPASTRDRFADLLAAGDGTSSVVLAEGKVWELDKVEQDLETAVSLWDRIGARWAWFKAGCALEDAGGGVGGASETLEAVRRLAFHFLHLAATSEASDAEEHLFSGTKPDERDPSIREQACLRLSECYESGFGVDVDRAWAEEWRRVAKLLEHERTEGEN